MLLQIVIQKSVVKILLKDGEKIIAQSGWDGDLSLSERLLSEIDALLVKAGVSKDDVEKVVASPDDESSVTSARIVETVAQAWNCTKLS